MVVSVQDAIVPASVLAGDPVKLAQVLSALRPADAAETLNGLDRAVAAGVLEAMPVQAAIQLLNEPHLEQPAKLVELMPVDCPPAILMGLHPDRRADIFRELPEEKRDVLKARLPAQVREPLEQLLRYPPQSAGGLMTTEFVSVPA